MKKVVEYLHKLCYILFRIVSRRSKGGDRMGIVDANVLSIYDVANYFRSKGKMTHKKLQKLVYYAYAWYIALYNENKDNIVNKLCPDTVFEAWVHGPVCKKLYDVYSYQYGIVEKYDGEISHLITGDLKKFLDSVYKTFGKYTGDELEYMSHNELPWKNARNTLKSFEPSHKIIDEKDMFIYYNSLNV